MSEKKPLILVTNDDGITAHGIRTLVSLMKQLGDVVVVAPDSPQSGMGHAITIASPLRLNSVDLYPGTPAYECSGTPADCVKLAKHFVLKDRSPDLVVSGINHGSNTSISVLYSGTMSAAIEAAIEGIPAIGFSLCDYAHDPDFSHTHDHILKIAGHALENGIPKGVTLNVNFPAKSEKPLGEIRICRQADARWQEEFDQRKDPYGRSYFWMSGKFVNNDTGEDTDEYALSQNCTSVVPCQLDLTDYKSLTDLKSWNINERSSAIPAPESVDLNESIEPVRQPS
ncbi:5'/3'-nucleotidase SurE [Larkinella knui]|uniref:5'-nucleotidase SurE n=1 Tax=Larkinella knui TaxID=2025310 RepID=A0A3P1CYM8_9BACT|nr:5'/3'-nucleotidase SurE [Larkinella knui]RRB18445.1 5'/3'-nucleotidase SurE [Larkinella knui]